MRLLLDTHILLWWVSDDPLLPKKARDAIADEANEVFVSAASAWEIAIKHALGRLTFPVDELEEIIRSGGFEHLPITASHAVAAGSLPRHHADPFDRMLIAQARAEGLTLVTIDGFAKAYNAPLLA